MSFDLPEPDLRELIGFIDQADADAAEIYSRKAINYETRFCVWAGQSEDGRKHRERLGREPFPWDGASDARVRLADIIINRNVNLIMMATMQARLQCQPVDASDAAHRQIVETTLKWMIYTHCLENFYSATSLAANIQQEQGLAIMGTFWERTTRTERQTLTMDALEMLMAESGDPRVVALIETIIDPISEDVAVTLLEDFLPGHGTLSAVRALRQQGVYEYEEPYIFQNLPKLVALEPWEDIYFPPHAEDLQSQPWVAWRELIAESELRSRILTDDYDEEFVEQALEHKGVRHRESTQWWTSNTSRYYTEANDERVELWHMYRKESTDDNATRVTCTVMHPSVPDLYGKHDLIPYAHGQYPFVPIRREHARRTLLECRGVPEIVASNQEHIKTQTDYRADRAALAIQPPLRVPANRGKLALLLGPRAELVERRQGEIDWMKPPPYDMGSLESEVASRRDAAEYFGRAMAGVDPTEAALTQQQIVSTWLISIKLVLTQILQLSQQYLTDAEVERVAGTLPRPFAATRQDIQGIYDVTVEFDARDLDNERLGAKLDYISKVIAPLDVMGVLDRAGLVKFAMSAVDPKMAELLVRDEQTATAMEAEQEQDALTKLWAGVEPPLAQTGQNAQLRLQIIQGQIQSNPQWQERYQGDELFRKMLDARAQSFEFQVQQMQNAQTGRTGAAQVLQGPAQQMLAGGGPQQ